MKIEVIAKKVLVKHVLSDEPYEQIRLVKDLKTFKAPMFFEVDDDEVVLEVIKQCKIQASTDIELMEKVVIFYIQNTGFVNEDSSKVMHSWQFLNGFTRTKITDAIWC